MTSPFFRSSRCLGAAAIPLLAGLFATDCRLGNLVGSAGAVDLLSYSALQSPAGAQGAFFQSLAQFNDAVAGAGSGENGSVIMLGGLLGDEFTSQVAGGYPVFDARYTAANETVGTAKMAGSENSGDDILSALLQSRSALLLMIGPLINYEPGASKSLAGLSYALVGYTELYYYRVRKSIILMDAS